MHLTFPFRKHLASLRISGFIAASSGRGGVVRVETGTWGRLGSEQERDVCVAAGGGILTGLILYTDGSPG